jgi:hypothetical protein
MSRSKLTNPSNDLVTDSGAVLWSIVRGEQLEYPVELDFLEDADDYTYEAVVIEADNLEGQNVAPDLIRDGGIQDTLVTRVPNRAGTWGAGNSYNYDDVVLYNAAYYRLLEGVGRINATLPDADPLWEEYNLNNIMVQFPSSLGGDYTDKATVGSPVYGFFELQVTAPTNPIYTQTFKPIRGMVELLFSPTEAVP